MSFNTREVKEIIRQLRVLDSRTDLMTIEDYLFMDSCMRRFKEEETPYCLNPEKMAHIQKLYTKYLES